MAQAREEGSKTKDALPFLDRSRDGAARAAPSSEKLWHTSSAPAVPQPALGAPLAPGRMGKPRDKGQRKRRAEKWGQQGKTPSSPFLPPYRAFALLNLASSSIPPPSVMGRWVLGPHTFAVILKAQKSTKGVL